MIQIRGGFRAGNPSTPMLRCLVTLPRLSRSRVVEFLVDTGADATTLHPLDTRQMAIRFKQHFAGIPRAAMRGIGGDSDYWEEMAELQFLHEDLAHTDVLVLPIHIAVPTRANSIIESLLGRDVLQHYRFTCDPANDLLLLERPG